MWLGGTNQRNFNKNNRELTAIIKTGIKKFEE